MDKLEKLHEELSYYSDRRIVVEVLNLLTIKQFETLVNTLKHNY